MNKTTHVLIVEDDDFLASIYKTKFEEMGFKISIATNGEDGLEMVKKKKPNCILLDILLPRLDGFGVLEALKKDSAVAKIPVILLTNLGQKEDVDKGLKLGAEAYLIKAHCKPSETVAQVKKILKI